MERLLGKIVMGCQTSPDHTQDSDNFKDEEGLAITEVKEGMMEKLKIVNPRNGSAQSIDEN